MSHMKSGRRLVLYTPGPKEERVGTATVVSVDTSDPKSQVMELKAASARQDGYLARSKGQQDVRRLTLVRQGQDVGGPS